MHSKMTLVLFVTLTFLYVPVFSAAVNFFVDDTAGFLAATASEALALAGTEDFEGSTLGGNQIVTMNDPLAPGVANTPFPTGTRTDSGVTAQSNTLGGSPAGLSPRGAFGLATASIGLAGTPSDQVSNNNPADSFDMTFAPDNGEFVRGVGMAPLYFDSAATGSTTHPGTLEIRVYAADMTTLLGTQSISAVDYSQTSFLGIVSSGGDVIGRINIWDQDGVDHYQGADDIQVWTSVNVPVELISFEIE